MPSSPKKETTKDWRQAYQQTAQELRDEQLCDVCKLHIAKRQYPLYYLNQLVGHEYQCENCRNSATSLEAFQTRRNLRFRDRQRFRCWEEIGALRTKPDQMTELVTRLINSYGGVDGVVSYAYVTLHDEPVPEWRRRIMLALMNMIRARDLILHEKQQEDLKKVKAAEFMAKVSETEALQMLYPLLGEIIDSRMDMVIEYLRTCGWTVIPPWMVSADVPIAASPYKTGSQGHTTPGIATTPLVFRESTKPGGRSSSAGSPAACRPTSSKPDSESPSTK